MSKLVIPIIVGTVRPQRLSIFAAEFIKEVAQQLHDVETVFVDPVNFPLPFDGNDPESKNPEYTEITKRADAFVIVVPEYNHSFPGSLKRLLDSELETYNHKPVAFAGVSSGPWGGVRAIEALVTATRETGLIASSVDLQFPFDGKLFVNGKMVPEQVETYQRRTRKFYDELIWLAKLLKSGREAQMK